VEFDDEEGLMFRAEERCKLKDRSFQKRRQKPRMMIYKIMIVMIMNCIAIETKREMGWRSGGGLGGGRKGEGGRGRGWQKEGRNMMKKGEIF
jgi:hypothetical protein